MKRNLREKYEDILNSVIKVKEDGIIRYLTRIDTYVSSDGFRNSKEGFNYNSIGISSKEDLSDEEFFILYIKKLLKIDVNCLWLYSQR